MSNLSSECKPRANRNVTANRITASKIFKNTRKTDGTGQHRESTDTRSTRLQMRLKELEMKKQTVDKFLTQMKERQAAKSLETTDKQTTSTELSEASFQRIREVLSSYVSQLVSMNQFKAECDCLLRFELCKLVSEATLVNVEAKAQLLRMVDDMRDGESVYMREVLEASVDKQIAGIAKHKAYFLDL